METEVDSEKHDVATLLRPRHVSQGNPRSVGDVGLHGVVEMLTVGSLRRQSSSMNVVESNQLTGAK